MPFRETYAGVENVWYVSPWIFPSVVLTLLLILSVVLTINAISCGGHRDVIQATPGKAGRFRLTRLGFVMVFGLVIGCCGALFYLIANIEKKIAFTAEEAKWLADPSKAEIFSWTDPFALIPVIGTSLVLIVALTALILASTRERAVDPVPNAGLAWYRRDSFVRFAVIVLLFVELVYVLIPRVDFFIAVLAFLTVFTASFHLDRADIIRRWMALYLAVGGGVVAIFGLGLDGPIGDVSPYIVDLAILAVFLFAMVLQWRDLSADPGDRAKYGTCLIIAWITPALLTPIFRFGLLVPLPHEGAVVTFLHQVRYLARQAGLLDFLSTGL